MAKRAGVYGQKALSRSLRQLQRDLIRPVGEAQRHALRPMLAAAKANVKTMGAEDTGELRRSLKVKKDSRAPKTKPTYLVGPDAKSPAVRYAHLVEFGTDAHYQPERQAWHPGASPKPFLSQAFHANQAEALKRFEDRIGPAIEKQAVRKAKRAGR